MAGSVTSLLIVGLWPSVILPGHLAASYHRRSLPPPGAAYAGGFAQLRACDIRRRVRASYGRPAPGNGTGEPNGLTRFADTTTMFVLPEPVGFSAERT